MVFSIKKLKLEINLQRMVCESWAIKRKKE